MKKQNQLFIFGILYVMMTALVVISCKDEDEPEPNPTQLPQLTTSMVLNISSNGASCGGNVTDDGGADVSDRGLVWSSTSEPTLSNNDGSISGGNGTGVFSLDINGLDPYTIYHIKAYATNSKGTAYGNELEFETLPEGAYGTVTDIEGNKYWTVAIGDFEWMAENLRTTKNADGTEIPTGLTFEQWIDTEEAAYTVYPYEDTLNGGKSIEPVFELDSYGLLYNAYVVLHGNPCPEGWYVPSQDNWQDAFLGLQLTYEVGEDEVGDIMKSCRQVNSPIGGGCKTDWHPRWDEDANSYGKNRAFFLALPSGELNPENGFQGLGELVNWWTSSPLSDSFTKRFGLRYNSSGYYGGASRNQSGYSIRCYRPLVKDE